MTGLVGAVLGEFRVQSQLGVGGMGTVYLARNRDGERVALKVVHPHLFKSPGFFKRFLREADVGKRVIHENVVRTFDADATLRDSHPVHFLAMEYVRGQTLRELQRELGRVPEERCRQIGRDVARALDAIHGAGAVHRDLKPENVLITDDQTIKVMDLGVAHLAEESLRLSQAGQFLGSVPYAAPEQFGDGEPDARADLYSLGLMLYELSTGLHPFAGTDIAKVIQQRCWDDVRPVAALNPELSPFFEEVVSTLMASEPARRFANAAEVAGILEDGEQGAWWGEAA